MNLDYAAWHDYVTRNARARLEYQAHPIVSAAVCEACDNNSATRYCKRCLP